MLESSGVYRVGTWEVIESHTLEIVLANARDTRAVPSRKRDVNVAQWFQHLHAFGTGTNDLLKLQI